MAQINTLGHVNSPIEGILKGLEAVQSVYGINTERQRQKILEHQNQLQEQASDPNSDYSKARQDATKASNSVIAQVLGPNMTPQAKEYLQKGNIEKQSGESLDKLNEGSPLLKLATGVQQAQAMGNKFNSLNDTKKEIQQNAIHEKVVNSLANDPVVKSRLTQYQNLSNSLSLLANADHITPQQFDEAQQSIRSNLGIKGTSGVDERGHTYLNSLGLSADRFQQILSGKPSSMDPNDPLLKHIKQLANLEQQNIQKQAADRVTSLAGGNSWLYNQRPDLKADLQSKIQGVTSQFAASTSPQLESSGAFSEGQTATNPKTGKKIIFKGGQWQPM